MKKVWIFMFLLITLVIVILTWNYKEGVINMFYDERKRLEDNLNSQNVEELEKDLILLNWEEEQSKRSDITNVEKMIMAKDYIKFGKDFMKYFIKLENQIKRDETLYRKNVELTLLGTFGNEGEAMIYRIDRGVGDDKDDLYVYYNNIYSIVKFNNKSLGRKYGISKVVGIGFVNTAKVNEYFKEYSNESSIVKKQAGISSKNASKSGTRMGPGKNKTCYFEVLVVHKGKLISFVTDFASVNVYKHLNKNNSESSNSNKSLQKGTVAIQARQAGFKGAHFGIKESNMKVGETNYTEMWDVDKKHWDDKWDDTYFFFEDGKLLLPYHFPVVVCDD